MDRSDEVYAFWMDEVGPSRWYAPDEALDAECARRFEPLVREARTGALDGWALKPRSALALLILVDQMPRNIWREKAEAFAGDRYAGAVAKRAINTGHDLKVDEPGRQFFYLPLMHQESIMDQDRCVRLMLIRMTETGAGNIKHAIAHREVIRLFGRFPTRNEVLKRSSTREEKAWLESGGYAKVMKEVEARA